MREKEEVLIRELIWSLIVLGAAVITLSIWYLT